MCMSRFSETLKSGFRIPFRNFQSPHFVVQGYARMPVRLSGAPLIERYGAPTIAQPHGPLAVKDYNPTHGIKFAPRLSPGIMGSPPITMTSKEVRAVCSASCCSVHRFACLSHRCASLSLMCISLTGVHLFRRAFSGDASDPEVVGRRLRGRQEPGEKLRSQEHVEPGWADVVERTSDDRSLARRHYAVTCREAVACRAR
jgi:hypothetical protein